MITWIQRYFQHHFKTVFAVLLVLTIVSFVFITNASGGFNRTDRQMPDRIFFGYNLSHPGDQQRLAADAQLSVSLQFGMMGGVSPEQMQNYAFNRAATLHLADQWHIPAATQAEVTDAIKNLRMFMGADGQFDAKAYQTFQDNLKTGAVGVRASDIARVLSDDVRVEKVNKLLSGPGYVLPADVKQQLKRFETSWTIATATADFAAFNPDIKPTEAELTKFFEESGGRYDIPPHVATTALEFNAAAFVAQVNPTEAEVRAFYDANPASFPKTAPATPAALTPAVTTPAADPGADFPLVRPQVEAAFKQERARQLAVKAASDFAVSLYDNKVTTPAALETFLTRQKLTPKALPPFPRNAPPAELGGAEAADQAFRLGESRVASGAIPTPNGAVVLFWKETIPSRKPLFAEVREKVAAEYTLNEKHKRFIEVGRTAKAQIEARLKAGDAFDKAVTTAASGTGLKLETKAVPAFTLRNRPQDLDYNAAGALDRMEQGQVSDMIQTPDDKGIFVYAQEKKAPDLSETSPAYAEARNQLASITGRIGASTYIAELVEKELKKSEPKVQ